MRALGRRERGHASGCRCGTRGTLRMSQARERELGPWQAGSSRHAASRARRAAAVMRSCRALPRVLAVFCPLLCCRACGARQQLKVHSTSGRVRSGRAASEAASRACPCRCGVAASLALMRRFRRLPWHHSAAKRAGGRRSPTRDQCRWVAAHVAHTLYGSGRAAGEPGSVCCARTGTCTARHQGQQASSGVASASDEDDQFGRRQRGLSFLLRVVRRSSGTGCRERFSGKGARQLGQGVREVGDGTEGSGRQLLRSTCAASGGEHVQAHRVVAAAARERQPHAHTRQSSACGLLPTHLPPHTCVELPGHGLSHTAPCCTL